MNSRNPQNTQELEAMLHKGLGRAILFLKDRDLTPHRDLILDCCLHNYAYEAPCEDNRARYLLPLINASPDRRLYRDEILRALSASTDRYDTDQLLGFAVLFAQDGDAEAREAIYARVHQSSLTDKLEGYEQAIELDGAQGLINVLDEIGASTLVEDWRLRWLISKAEDVSDIEEACAALREARDFHPGVAASLSRLSREYSPDWSINEILEGREEEIQRRHGRHADAADGMNWDDVKESPDFDSLVFHWPRVATDEEFELCARDLDPQTEPKRLRSHLQAFRKRAFPLGPELLIKLVDHPDEPVVISALSALELIRHDSVRALFNRLRQSPKWSDRSIALLRSNYRDGDDKLIMHMLENEMDADSLHLMCINTREVYKDNPSPDALQPLIIAYDKTPCSMCRCSCFKQIIELDRPPDWMIEECLYDADQSTREMAVGLKLIEQ